MKIENGKNRIRNEILEIRSKLSNNEIELRSRSVIKPIVNIINKLSPKTVASYRPFRNEVNISIVDKKLKENKINVLYPRISDSNKITFHHSNKFETHKFGFEQPPENSKEIVPDIIICPIVGIDKNNKRLGYGGGYYDRFWQKYPDIIYIGIGYDFQFIENFEAEEYDLLLNSIVLV